MTKIFALQIDFGPAEAFRQTFGKIQLGGTADIILEVIGQLPLELSVLLGLCIFLFQFQQGRHQRFRNVASAVRTESTAAVRNRRHALSF